MKLLADESLEAPVVVQLRAAGHYVEYVAESLRGADDTCVLQRAVQLGCILVTNDKDFAEMTFLQHAEAPGIVLVRMPEVRSLEKGKRLVDALSRAGNRLVGRMTVVSNDALRSRPLPIRS